MKWVTTLFVAAALAFSSTEASAQWTSRPNIMGGYDVYGPGGQTWSSRGNIFGGLSW